jgi:hypothetical protein
MLISVGGRGGHGASYKVPETYYEYDGDVGVMSYNNLVI